LPFIPSFSRNIVTSLGFGNFISAVIGDGDGVKTKPAPDMIFNILGQIALDPEEVVFVGDSPSDIESGVNAGVKTVGITTGFFSREALQEAGADVTIDRLNQLERIF